MSLLLIHGVLVFSTANYCTVTHDEYWHVPVGLYNLRYQRFDFDDLNPPLGRMVAAAPLLFLADQPEQPPVVRKDLWNYGDEFVEQHGDRFHSLIVAARCTGIVLSIVFAMLAASWATEELGIRSGLITLALWSLSPSLIANAALATNDLFVSGLFLMAVWRVRKLAISGTLKDSVIVGAVIGMACLVKFTGLLLFGVIPLCLLTSRPKNLSSPSWLKLAGRISVSFVVAIFLINAGYLFHGSASRLGDYTFTSEACRLIQSKLEFAAAAPVPLPSSFVTGVDHQRTMMEGEHPIYLWGRWSETGFWNYFICVVAWKLPHGFQLLIAITTYLWWQRRKLRRQKTDERATTHSLFTTLLIPAVVLFSIGSVSGMQLGLRYILPAIPLLIIYASRFAANNLPSPGRFVAVAGWIAVASSVVAVRHHPHHLAYFNEYSGGPINGRTLLSDSNIDWGQDLRALKNYLDSQPEVRDLKLAYFGTFPPQKLGIEFQIPPQLPEPGWYALSVNMIQGRPNPVRLSDGSKVDVFKDRFGYIRYFEPHAYVGKSIRVYLLTDEDAKQWRINARAAAYEL